MTVKVKNEKNLDYSSLIEYYMNNYYKGSYMLYDMIYPISH